LERITPLVEPERDQRVEAGAMRWKTTAAILCLLAAGCTHERTGSVDRHFADFQSREPKGNTVWAKMLLPYMKWRLASETEENFLKFKSLAEAS